MPMSLTQAENVFVGIHENGINDFLTAFFTARPRYLNYGTSFFVSSTSAAATNISTIGFPGVPGGIQFAVSFSIPVVDIFPNSSGAAVPLLPANGQFSLSTKVTLTVGCGVWEDSPSQPGNAPPPPPSFHPLMTMLDLFALGHVTHQYFSPGNGLIHLRVDAVEIVDIQPDSLESVFECLLRMMLDAAISNLVLPFQALSVGAFSLVLLRGPELNNDHIKIYGTV
jgi:hypothetical protein